MHCPQNLMSPLLPLAGCFLSYLEYSCCVVSLSPTISSYAATILQVAMAFPTTTDM